MIDNKTFNMDFYIIVLKNNSSYFKISFEKFAWNLYEKSGFLCISNFLKIEYKHY